MAGMTKMQVAIDLLKTKVNTLNATLLKNPYALAAAGIVALGIAVYKFVNAASAAEKAQQKLNDRIKTFNDMEESRRSQIDKLIATMQDENETTLEKVKAYEQLAKLSPILVKNYTHEEIATNKLTGIFA